MMERNISREGAVLHDKYKICLSGAHGVGKTSIFECLRRLVYKDTRTPSGGIDFLEYILPGLNAKIQLYDTPIGMTDHSMVTLSSYYRNAACIIFVYDVTELDSLHTITQEYMAFTERSYCPDAKYVILRNKIDQKLKSRVGKDYQENHIREQAPELWENLFCTNETSAVENKGIETFFMKDLEDVLRNVEPARPNTELQSRIHGDDRKTCCGF